MESYFNDLLTYNRWANQQVIGLFLTHSESYQGRQKTLICHTLNAHMIWNTRLNKELEHRGVWTEYSLEELEELDQRNHTHTLEAVKGLDLNTLVSYQTTTGEAHKNLAHDLVAHIINHSTYHRGQLMTAFKEMGITPIATDYVIYKRNLN